MPDTCPVCAHTPLSTDLCKPNKALRTTLKAFLRTEEKKREKDRQSATPAAPAEALVDGTPAPSEQPGATPAPDTPAAAVAEDQAPVEEHRELAPAAEFSPDEHPAADSRPVEAGEELVPDANAEVSEESQAQVFEIFSFDFPDC